MKYLLLVIIFAMSIAGSLAKSSEISAEKLWKGPLLSPQAKRNITKLILKAGLSEGQAERCINATETIVKLDLGMSLSKIYELAEIVPDIIVFLVQNTTGSCENQFRPEIIDYLSTTFSQNVPEFGPDQILEAINSYQILVFEVLKLSDEAVLRQVLGDLIDIMINVLIAHQQPRVPKGSSSRK